MWLEFALIVIGVAFFIWMGGSYLVVRGVETPKYKVLKKHNQYEIREYNSYIIAYTEVEGSFKDSLNEGFKRLANYIFGGNRAKSKVEMTAPVIQEKQQRSEKIEMTAPVIQEKQQDIDIISFVMPSKYTLETLPDPLDARVKLKEEKSKKVAVYPFRGRATQRKVIELKKHFIELLKKEYSFKKPIRLAQYNPPFTIPFMRHNELHADLSDE